MRYACAQEVAETRLRRAQRTAVAQALWQAPLDWQAIDACPAWAVAWPGAPERERLCLVAGAWWLAASLRACIDGRQLAEVAHLLGQDLLNAVRAHQPGATAAPRPMLVPAPELPEQIRACGQNLLAWSLPPALKTPVLEHLGWPHQDPYPLVFDSHDAWARQALQRAQEDALASAAAADPDVGEDGEMMPQDPDAFSTLDDMQDPGDDA